MLLDAARHDAVDCPYWSESDPDFAGIESDEARVVILAESSGSGGVRFAGGDIGVGGGGGGRLFGAYGIGRFTLGIGAELGADGSLPETEDGGRTFEAVLSSSAMFLMRYTYVSRVLDVELSYRTLYNDERRHGFRIDIGYGITTPRVAGFMPYGLLWIGYETYPSARGQSAEHAVLVGTRVGFDWDP